MPPGDFFPQSFAMGILQLKQQKEQRAAELAEMRNQRAAQNFMDKERLALQAQAQAQQAQLGYDTLASQERRQDAELKVQEAAQTARIQLEVKQIEATREQSVARSLQEFAQTGNAFIPSYAASEVPKLTQGSGTSDPYKYAKIELPGLGTVVQRIGGPGFEKQSAEMAKLEAMTEKYRQEGALAHKRQEQVDVQTQVQRQNLQLGKGKFSTEKARLATQASEGLRKIAEAKAQSLLALGGAENKKKAAMIADDPREAFPEGSKDRILWDQYRQIQESWTLTETEGIPHPKQTDVETVRALGLEDAVYGEPPQPPQPQQAPPARIVGRIGELKGGKFKGFFIDERGNQIPTTDFGSLISTGGATASAAAQAAAPAGPAAQPSETENAEREANVKIFEEAKAAKLAGTATPEQKAAGARAQAALKAFRDRYGR